ncbi:hypothetical protein [Undibacterium sp. TS12]|uniref:hypothetical protein n=1 Tax=Undibacterium sp. TS12 TaxID=2908202 RepID=UPI001F4CA23E|nr:hypothetical protein [Undibacterium sp. TS12]MCH8622476.1 hypothetical protein [Undibacterium sp. TS12]
MRLAISQPGAVLFAPVTFTPGQWLAFSLVSLLVSLLASLLVSLLASLLASFWGVSVHRPLLVRIVSGSGEQIE